MQLRGTIDDIIAIFNRVQGALPTIKAIALDPAFPQVVTRVQTLYDLAPTTTMPSSPGSATGYQSKLAVLIKPLDALIYLRKNPWAFWAGLAGIVVAIGGIGYRMGQQKGAR